MNLTKFGSFPRFKYSPNPNFVVVTCMLPPFQRARSLREGLEAVGCRRCVRRGGYIPTSLAHSETSESETAVSIRAVKRWHKRRGKGCAIPHHDYAALGLHFWSFFYSRPSIHRDLETELAKKSPSGLLQPVRKEEEEEVGRRGAPACRAGGEPDADATTIRSKEHTGLDFTLIWLSQFPCRIWYYRNIGLQDISWFR